MKHMRKDQGFTLIEVIVAFMLLVIGILSSVSMFTVANRVERHAVHLIKAADLAKITMEYLRLFPIMYKSPLCTSASCADVLKYMPDTWAAGEVKIGTSAGTAPTTGNGLVMLPASGSGTGVTDSIVLGPDCASNGTVVADTGSQYLSTSRCDPTVFHLQYSSTQPNTGNTSYADKGSGVNAAAQMRVLTVYVGWNESYQPTASNYAATSSKLHTFGPTGSIEGLQSLISSRQ